MVNVEVEEFLVMLGTQMQAPLATNRRALNDLLLYQQVLGMEPS